MDMRENEPAAIEGLVDIVRDLSEYEGLLLSRNYLQRVALEGRRELINVHYEDLNNPPEPKIPSAGRPVMYEFYRAAMQLMGEGRYIHDGPAYPILSVVNSLTGATESKVVDVVELIAEEALPIYSSPARIKGGGEMLVADFSHLARGLIERVGRVPEQSVAMSEGSIIEYANILPHGRSFLRKEHSIGAEVPSMQIERRGETALHILQMDIAQSFINHGHRDVDLTRGNVEVSLSVAARPDMQNIMLSLIDLVESCGLKLYLFKDNVNTGETGYVFSIVNDDIELAAGLSADTSLMTAVYDAYNSALDIFPELQH